MNKRTGILAGILIVSLVMLACTLPIFSAPVQQKNVPSISDSVLLTLVAQNQYNQPQPLSNAEIVATSVAQTVVALNAQNQNAAAVPPPTNYVVVAPTATPYPCNSATAIDITVPDYTNFSLNQSFNKTWRFRNVGICTWNTGYRLAFYSGNSLNAPSYVYLPYSVAPGGTVDVTVPMQAPSSYGTYTGYWGLYTDSNYFFGRVWVTITAGSTVSPTLGTFAVTGVSFAQYLPDTDCKFSATITANGAGTVNYTWKWSDNMGTLPFNNQNTGSVTFSGAGSQTVVNTFTTSATYTIHMYILPNHQEFGDSTIFTCP
jgi:hypothetical protein